MASNNKRRGSGLNTRSNPKKGPSLLKAVQRIASASARGRSAASRGPGKPAPAGTKAAAKQQAKNPSIALKAQQEALASRIRLAKLRNGGDGSVQPRPRTTSFDRTVANRNKKSGKDPVRRAAPPAPKLPAPPTRAKAKPAPTPKLKPRTKAQSAYAKDARNKEYDRLRKAGKTKEAEALGKKISADARKKAPKNPYRAPQGAERKDTMSKQVASLKAARARFNKGQQVSPERGRSFDEPLSADRRNKGRRNNNIA